MKIIDSEQVADALPYDALIDVLDEAFKAGAINPDRTHHEIEVPGATRGTLLLMPCWRSGKNIGVKIATVFPGNAKKGLPAVHASYFLMDAETGEPLAVMDGTELTRRRTAAASALGSRYLSREDSKTMLMVGTGALAPHLVTAHAAARPIERVLIWGRREEAGNELAEVLSPLSLETSVITNLQAAVRAADIISCATLAEDPLIKGAWLQKGQHLDLVGAFKADMREADAVAVSRAEVYVDTYNGAMSEAGDILIAIQEGAIQQSDIVGDLAELVQGTCQGRTSSEAITLFKSVGTGLEDLAAAVLVMRNHDA